MSTDEKATPPEGGQLTDEQIQNWRDALYPIYGVWIRTCPREQVQQLRDQMQANLDERYKASTESGEASKGEEI